MVTPGSTLLGSTPLGSTPLGSTPLTDRFKFEF
jgi:hypothetical protein